MGLINTEGMWGETNPALKGDARNIFGCNGGLHGDITGFSGDVCIQLIGNLNSYRYISTDLSVFSRLVRMYDLTQFHLLFNPADVRFRIFVIFRKSRFYVELILKHDAKKNLSRLEQLLRDCTN